MGLFDIKPKPVSNDPTDWVYEGRYNRAGRVVSFKFNPVKGVHPEDAARNMVFQDFKDDSGAISRDLYVVYLQAQSSLTVKKDHQIED